jgi:hypothetical protein
MLEEGPETDSDFFVSVFITFLTPGDIFAIL